MADPFADFWGPSPTPQGPLATQLLNGQPLPAGMRNNNPGNIKYFAGLNYPGMVGPSQNRDQGDPQMVFDTPQNGMNAAATLALKKYSGGKRTANDLIAGEMGWTPGNTDAAKNIATTMGLTPADDLQLSDPTRMRAFLKALTMQEHGPASKLYGDDVYAGVGGGAAPATSRPQNGTTAMAMPDPQQPAGPLSNAMGGISNSLVPGIFGGGDQPGYFGKLLADPTFLMGTSVLGAGLSGRDLGTALTQGAQAATATTEMADRRRRAMTWQKLFGNGQPDVNSPILKGLPPEVLPVIQNMGPEEGMKLLGQFAMQRLAPHKLASAAPGSTVYDEQTQQPLFQAPSESPYQKELQQAQAKADVKQGQSAQAGQQMLDLTDRMISLAGPEGSEQRKTFGDATGPIQGTNWYQGIKGFVNSKAETPVVYRNLQQDLGTIKLLASRAYLSGEGQVSDNERRMVGDAVGNVESAPNAEAAVQAMTNLKQIVNQVFMKPKMGAGQPALAGAPAMAAPAPAMPAPGGSAAPPPPGMMPPEAPPQIPGMSVTGGPPPGPAPAPQGAPPPGAGPQPGGPAPVTATGPKGEKVQLDPASGQWMPMQVPPPQAGAAPGGAPSPAVGAPADRGPFTGPRPKGPNILDRWVLRSEVSRNPAIIQQYDAAFGKGAAAQILSSQQPPPSSFTSQGALP